MAFGPRGRRNAKGTGGAPGGVAHNVGTAGSRVIWLAARFCLAVSVIVVLSGGVLFLRLSQGPVELPGLSRYLVERANATSENVRVAARTVFLDLGDGTVPTGLEFRDVEVRSIDGAPLFAVPRLRASFDLTDLVRGEVHPTRISVISASARFLRDKDGRIRFGLGGSEGIVLDGEDASTSEEGIAAVSNLVNGFVGDAELSPEVSKLRKIEVLNANIHFIDRMTDGTVSARNANLKIRRDDGGATAILDINGAGAEGDVRSGVLLRLVADRRKGAGTTAVAGRFGHVDPRELASVLPLAGMLDGLETVLAGEISARFGADGLPAHVAGVIVADGGSWQLKDQQHNFDVAALSLNGNLKTGVIEVTNGLINSEAGEARLTALVHLNRDVSGAVASAGMQIDIEDLALAGGGFFADPVQFSAGQIAAYWESGVDGLRIAESWLARDDLVFRLSGRLGWPDGRITADLTAEAGDMDASDLVRHWPAEMAPNARRWTNDNISAARLHSLTAQMRLRGDDAKLALSAGYSDMTASYIDGMSPIRGAAGELFMDLDQMLLTMETGTAAADGNQPVTLAGSSVVISGFDDHVTPADIRIQAAGATKAVLALIDEEPLHLVRSLGLDLGVVKGRADIRARLRFPLIDDLRIKDVDVDTKATLTKVDLAVPTGASGTVKVRANQLEVSADVRRMRLAGKVVVDGAPIDLDWREDYSSSPGQRQVRITGVATPELVTNLGLDDDIFTGSARVALDVTQRGSDEMRFQLTADLTKTGLKVMPLNWEKPAGSKGSLKAEGRLGRSAVIDKMDFEAPGLTAAGGVEFDSEGGILRANFTRVTLPGRLDSAVSVQTAADGVPEIRLIGRLLDVSREFAADDRDAGQHDPVRVRLSLERLKVTESLVIALADGRFERQSNGTLSGAITGSLGPDAPVAIELNLPVEGAGAIKLSSPNAGAALRYTDIYRGATGGSLKVDAQITRGAGGEVTGRARIDDVVVRSQATFKNVLEDGGLADAGAAVSSSGIGFRSVSVPFRYRDGVVTVTDAIATSPALGLKLTGTLNEKTEAIDLTGVLSPAYALTGALNEIPVLGEILSGGRGEGIVGMTFTLKGAMRDPQFSVNPLSLLAPGLLRKMFTGTGGTSDDGGTVTFRSGNNK